MEPPQTILIVDDQKHMLAVLHATLSGIGYRIVTVASAPEALAQAASPSVALLLTDYEMPGMNGVEITRRVRESANNAHVPIIMITGRGQNRVRAEADRAGVSLVISKPFSPTELLDTIQRLLAGQRGSAPWPGFDSH